MVTQVNQKCHGWHLVKVKLHNKHVQDRHAMGLQTFGMLQTMADHASCCTPTLQMRRLIASDTSLKQYTGVHTIAIIINAIVWYFSIVHPDVGCQVWVVGLDARVNDAHRYVAAANGLLIPVTRRLNQVQVVQGVAIRRVSILY